MFRGSLAASRNPKLLTNLSQLGSVNLHLVPPKHPNLSPSAEAQFLNFVFRDQKVPGTHSKPTPETGLRLSG